ncbi:MAG: WbqC family protein [Cytophagales bacterium]|nr:WbqC family protein [Cytophagales bacterium]MCA6388554.1 WbqC family protein [Cytophagales bacterium]MCA6390513.1 WbqC family protein [Cytophagales bacterium]MCA6394056.1 WbqC family protein [Cytophagales bacterium]MCA6399910.1 WbqC family protein [Cytophagales bacterium]
MKKIARIELQYLPCLEYFCALLSFDVVELEFHEHYLKQTFRNRCYINTSQGVQMLIVPLKEKHGKISVQEIRIDYQQKWQNNHWRSIESAYRNAPYFEHYADELKKIIYLGHEHLLNLNKDLLSFCLRVTHLKVEVSTTQQYEKVPSYAVSDLRGTISPKQVAFERTFYHPISYQQVFGNTFVSNLSILDLLFCEGPKSIDLLRASLRSLNK